MITIRADDMRMAEDMLRQIPKGVEKAASRALNRAIRSGATAAARKAREEYYVLHRSIISTIKIHPATESRLIARAVSKGPRRELMDFRVNPTAPRKVPVVRVAVRKSTGYKDLRGAFVAKGKSTAKTHVLRRAGKERYPIHIKYGPAVPEMIGSQRVRPFVEERALDVLSARLEHEIGRLLGGAR